ncbi:MAG: hypothetical protein ACTSSN_10390 [Candidatus Heimdallarchaeaceae archaeon]
MRKIVKILIIIFFIAILAVGSVFLAFFWNNLTFNPGERYVSDNLNYMNVIYENRSDNYAFNEGYSESTSCPWGFIHNGLDYFFLNNSKVISASPGQVEEISWRDNGEGIENRFYVSIRIRFNKSITLGYNFEPWTQNPADKDKQLAMVLVQEGDWVELGQEIARFLYVQESAHIHFDVSYNNQQTCPEPFFSTAGYNEMMTMIHIFQPSWELCYP